MFTVFSLPFGLFCGMSYDKHLGKRNSTELIDEHLEGKPLGRKNSFIGQLEIHRRSIRS